MFKLRTPKGGEEGPVRYCQGAAHAEALRDGAGGPCCDDRGDAEPSSRPHRPEARREGAHRLHHVPEGEGAAYAALRRTNRERGGEEEEADARLVARGDSHGEGPASPFRDRALLRRERHLVHFEKTGNAQMPHQEVLLKKPPSGEVIKESMPRLRHLFAVEMVANLRKKEYKCHL